MDNVSKKTINHAGNFTIYAGFFVVTVGIVIFTLRVKTGLDLFKFGDEIEKFVAAQMINQGLHLYRDIFSHHGPVPYIIAHLYTLIVSQSDFSYIRVFQALLAITSVLALAYSPIFKSFSARAWAVGLYLMLLSSVWVLQSIHMILYHPIGGFLLTIPCAQLFAPLFFSVTPNKYGLFASGAAVALACFTAYAFGPSCLLLISASLMLIFVAFDKTKWWALIKPVLFGIFLTTLAVIAWLLIFADPIGFFVYHFYFNQQVYSTFINFSFAGILNIFSFSLSSHKIIHAITLSFFIFWVCVFFVSVIKQSSAKLLVTKYVALALALAVVLFTNPRGATTFHNSAFVIVNLALFALAVGWLLEWMQKNFYGTATSILVFFVAVTFTEYLSNYAISSPHGVIKRDLISHTVQVKPEQSPVYDLIRALTKEEGDLLSLIFNPILYIKADRLPASGHYYYLPWQAKYNKNPVGDYKIDLCNDIKSREPTVIWFDNWKVWDRFSIEEYEPCVSALIRNNYSPSDQFDGGLLMIRNDLLPIDPATRNRFKQDSH
jgi:hypothetical protein